MMRIYNTIDTYIEPAGYALSVGSFDGLHIGHRAVIDSGTPGIARAVLTFAEHPAAALGRPCPPLLQSNADRRQMLTDWNVSALIEADFAALCRLSPADFVGQLAQCLRPSMLCVGYNFRFGAGAQGNVKELRTLCRQQGIALCVTDPVSYLDAPVSSTRIRAAVADGELADAAAMLGRPFALTLPVTAGDRRGREWGLRTLNQIIDPAYACPRFGVYLTAVTLDEKTYNSVTNVGLRPTFAADRPLLETHILDYMGDLYDQAVTVQFGRFLRPERQFDQIADLRAQIEQDIACRRAEPNN